MKIQNRKLKVTGARTNSLGNGITEAGKRSVRAVVTGCVRGGLNKLTWSVLLLLVVMVMVMMTMKKGQLRCMAVEQNVVCLGGEVGTRESLVKCVEPTTLRPLVHTQSLADLSNSSSKHGHGSKWCLRLQWHCRNVCVLPLSCFETALSF